MEKTFTRQNYASGAPLEEKFGYSRMVKVGPYIMIGGTTSVQPDGSVYGEDLYTQCKYIFEKQIKLLEQAGATVGDVISVRGFAPAWVTDTSGWDQAYSEIFHGIRPCSMLLGINKLNRPTQLVEIEMTAIAGGAIR